LLYLHTTAKVGFGNGYRAAVSKIVAIDSLCNIYFKCCL